MLPRESLPNDWLLKKGHFSVLLWQIVLVAWCFLFFEFHLSNHWIQNNCQSTGKTLFQCDDLTKYPGNLEQLLCLAQSNSCILLLSLGTFLDKGSMKNGEAAIQAL